MGEHSHMYQNHRWRKLRLEQLRKFPLCERCQEQGLIVEATICDHVQPHKGDMARFWSGPFSSLCKHHHDCKTIMEDGGLNSGAATHPEWIPLPACPVVLVTGSPGAGKTTYARRKASIVDVVIDLDECFFDVCGTHGHEAGVEHLNAALRLRNKMLASLCSKRAGKAYVIVGSPSADETRWWLGKLNATHVLIEADERTCLDRVTPARRHAVTKWHQAHRRNLWERPVVKKAIGLDGWPVEA